MLTRRSALHGLQQTSHQQREQHQKLRYSCVLEHETIPDPYPLVEPTFDSWNRAAESDIHPQTTSQDHLLRRGA